jgi:REP element-mobilizing transposase RayT
MLYPMGFHITWGTYGTRLHGSAKPHVDNDHNEYGTPFPPRDSQREQESRDRMKFDPVYLTPEQRKLVEKAIREIAKKYGWTIHALAVQSDHVHVVLTAMREGEKLRDALKAVASRALNIQFGEKTWWAEKGSAKYLWELSYFHNAVGYVSGQRDF